MNLGQGRDTPFVHERQLCEVSSKCYLPWKSYVLDMNFGYMCTMTLNFDMVSVVTHHRQQFCEKHVLSKSNLVVRSYGQDTDFG